MTVNVALIGAGRIARVHATAYRKVSGARLSVCTDPVAGSAASLASDFGLATAPDIDAVLRDSGVDAVIIASPNALHPEQTIAALTAGKHVFCQKPIALTVAEADRVVKHASESGRVLQFGFMLRFTPPLPEVHRAAAAGEFGSLIAAQAAIFGWEPVNDWFYDPAQGGGVILDTLVHFADFVLWTLGDAVQVYAQGGAFLLDGARGHRSPDNATVQITHASGAVSSLYVSWTAGHGNFRLDVFGTAGHATVDLTTGQALSVFRRAQAAGAPAGWTFPDMVWEHGYTGEQQYFVDRINGTVDGSLAATPAAARNALALVIAAQKSLDENRVITL